ncbi:MAG: hypothetical protein ACYC4U_30200 [Pirellulaceae bacterium]
MACSVGVFVITIVVLLWGNVARSRLWRPSIATLGAEPVAQSDVAVEAIEQHNLLGRNEISPNGRLIANLNGHVIQLFDLATSNVVARFQAPPGQWFVTMTFLADSSALVAIPAVPKTSGIELFQWKTDGGEEQVRPFVDNLKNHSGHGETFPFLTEGILLLVHIDDDDPARTRLDISMLDLLDDCRIVKRFASVTADLATRIDRSALSDPFGFVSYRFRSIPLLQVSPDRAWIVSAQGVFEPGYCWLLRRDSNQIRKVRGDPLAFLSDGDRVVIREESWQLIARSRTHVYGRVPPFWKPPWNVVTCYRVCVLDALTGERLARSAWWNCNRPSWDPAQRVVRAAYEKGFLTWDISDAVKRP